MLQREGGQKEKRENVYKFRRRSEICSAADPQLARIAAVRPKSILGRKLQPECRGESLGRMHTGTSSNPTEDLRKPQTPSTVVCYFQLPAIKQVVKERLNGKNSKEGCMLNRPLTLKPIKIMHCGYLGSRTESDNGEEKNIHTNSSSCGGFMECAN